MHAAIKQGPERTGAAESVDLSASRSWLVALSFANLFYLRTWAAILEADRNIQPVAYLMAVITVLILGVCFRWAWRRIQSSSSPWIRRLGHIAIATLLLVPFHAITTIYFSADPRKANLVYAAAILTGAALFASSRVRRLGLHLLVIASPFVAITFGQSLWRAAVYDASRWSEPTAPTTATRTGPRVLWVVFDEWDYGLTFESRPKWLQTPALNSLRAISFHASHAVPPGPETALSIPRLITGDMTADTKRLPGLSSIFHRAKAEGFQSTVAGWHYINYCGTLSQAMATCWTNSMDAERSSMGLHPVETAANQLRNLFENEYKSPFGQSVGTKRHILDYKSILRHAVEAAKNPAYDLVFVHMPIPHPPLFYDRATHAYDLYAKPLSRLLHRDPSAYWDSLELVDLTVGQIRQSIESAGLWDRTSIIMSSDHPYRHRSGMDGVSNDTRVPFIVRVGGAPEGILYEQPFNTVVSGDLVMALLRGQISSSAHVGAAIDRVRASR